MTGNEPQRAHKLMGKDPFTGKVIGCAHEAVRDRNRAADQLQRPALGRRHRPTQTLIASVLSVFSVVKKTNYEQVLPTSHRRRETMPFAEED